MNERNASYVDECSVGLKERKTSHTSGQVQCGNNRKTSDVIGQVQCGNKRQKHVTRGQSEWGKKGKKDIRSEIVQCRNGRWFVDWLVD